MHVHAVCRVAARAPCSPSHGPRWATSRGWSTGMPGAGRDASSGGAVSAVRLSPDSDFPKTRRAHDEHGPDPSPLASGGLQVPRRRPRRRVALSRPRPVPATAVNHVWAYDFVFDTCANGQTLKCLTVVDEWTRESLAIGRGRRHRSGRVIEVLTQLVSVHGAHVTSGPTTAPSLSRVRFSGGCSRRRSKPRSSSREAVAECDRRIVQRKFRDEYLSLQWFRTAWTRRWGSCNGDGTTTTCDRTRALGYLTPAEFKAQLRAGSDDGGRSPAMPAHADQEEHESDLTMPTGAVLQ